MAEPAFQFFEYGSTVSTGTLITSLNPIVFDGVDKGIPTAILSIDVWNDRGGALGSDTAIAPRIYPMNGEDIVQMIFDGTELNDYVSMLEARSCAAFGVAADQHTEWTPIRPTNTLVLGNMPSNSRRTIELRVNAPVDANALTPLKHFILMIAA